MLDFEIIEHKADLGVIAYGADLKGLFGNAGRGVFNIIAGDSQILNRVTREIRLRAPGLDSLLVYWLNELIYLVDTENLIFGDFKIVEIKQKSLQALCHGEKIDPSRHSLYGAIKAATYHNLEIKRTEKGYSARIIFDI